MPAAHCRVATFDGMSPTGQVRLGQIHELGRLGQPLQMRFDQTGPAVADQQRLEDAVAANRRQVVGVQQRRSRRMYLAVQRDDHTRLAGHGREAYRLELNGPRRRHREAGRTLVGTTRTGP